VGATAGLEDAWDELRALATDRGVAWPPGSSRAVAAVIAPELPEPARTEFDRLALHVELDRYSAQPVPADDLPARVLVIERGMKQRWAQPAARFDRWWPRSLRTR
ncbi:MAG: hypothetical protein WAL91_00275, partial [Propionicimonas sp.]